MTTTQQNTKGETMTITNTTTQKAYFRNNPQFGRTTKLIEKATGRVLFEGMGICSRKELWKTYQA